MTLATTGFRPTHFPVQVWPWFSAHAVMRSSGTACPNNPPGYTAQGVRQPPERPILYDAFDEPRGDVLHRALDITCAEGSLVVAMTSGVVPATVATSSGRIPGAGTSPRGGNYVFIRDAAGYTAYYAHLRDRPKVSPGDSVSAGQVIGYCGRTGNALPGCPHLHLAVTDPSNNKINPIHALEPMYQAGGWKRGFPWSTLLIGGFAVAGVYVGYRAYRNRSVARRR